MCVHYPSQPIAVDSRHKNCTHLRTKKTKNFDLNNEVQNSESI